MKQILNRSVLTAFTLSVSLLASQNASAVSVGIMGGGSWAGQVLGTDVSKPSFLYGAEITYGTILDIGVFYEKNSFRTVNTSILYGTNSSVDVPFYGLLGRLNFNPIFVDAKLGLTHSDVSVVGIPSSDTAVGYGLGVGYKYNVAPFFDLMPRLGYRSLPFKQNGTTTNQSTVDLSLMFAFLF